MVPPALPYPVRPVATPSDFQTPDIDENTIWDEDFYLRVTVIDDPNTDVSPITRTSGANGSGSRISQQIMLVLIQQKLTVVQLGVDVLQSATAVDTDDSNKDETDYLIHLSPNADRITTAGEEVTITITPVDKAG